MAKLKRAIDSAEERIMLVSDGTKEFAATKKSGVEGDIPPENPVHGVDEWTKRWRRACYAIVRNT